MDTKGRTVFRQEVVRPSDNELGDQSTEFL
jgi:hypothetical protein